MKTVHDLELISEFSLIYQPERIIEILNTYTPHLYFQLVKYDEKDNPFVDTFKFLFIRLDDTAEIFEIYGSTQEYSYDTKVIMLYPEDEFPVTVMKEGGIIESNVIEDYEINVLPHAKTDFEKRIGKSILIFIKSGVNSEYDKPWVKSFKEYTNNILSNYNFISDFFTALRNYFEQHKTEFKF